MPAKRKDERWMEKGTKGWWVRGIEARPKGLAHGLNWARRKKKDLGVKPALR